MLFNITKKAKGFITNPVESFRQSREDRLGDVIKYFVVILAIFATFSSFIVAIGTGVGNEIGYFIGYFVVYFIAGFIGLFVGGAAIHLIGRIIGGWEEGFGQVLKVLVYSSTPAMLLGWIPVVGVISGLWAIIILILGIRELYRISTVRAVIASFLSAFNAITISIVLLTILVILVGGDDVLGSLVFIVFISALLALFDGGAHICCKSWREPPADWQSPSPSVFVPSPNRQKHPKEDGLFFDQISTVSSQMTGTLQRIETGLQRMKTAHPTWMERPEFAPLVNNIQENLIDPSKYGDTERLYMQLESRVEQIEQSVNDLDRLIGGLDQLRK
jgi:hypothetical protein